MIYGVTLDDIDEVDSAIPSLRDLPFKPMARVVVDNGRDLSDYLEPVKRLLTVCDVMIQVQDSFDDSSLTTSAYVKKFVDLIDLFQGVNIAMWEIGNEVSGDWLSPNIWQKVKQCAVIAQNKNLKTAITFFMDEDLAPFLQSHEPVHCDVVLISCYPSTPKELRKMNERLPGVLDELKSYCTATEAGVGEYGPEEWDSKHTIAVRSKLVEVFDLYNGGFYWDFQQDCVPKRKAIWRTISDTWKNRK